MPCRDELRKWECDYKQEASPLPEGAMNRNGPTKPWGAMKDELAAQKVSLRVNTNSAPDREVLLLRLRNAIADKEWTIACANKDSFLLEGVWSCDWHKDMREAQEEINWVLHQLDTLL